MPTRRVSHSLLDPYLTVPLKRLYPYLAVPAWLPPEAIVVSGHLAAVIGAVGFAYSTSSLWGGWLLAAGVAANHTADCLDGTHARASNQCRNGGELLDHFFDPLSFSYWLVGLAVSVGRLDLGLAAVIVLYATAVLTNIKAKLIGEFALASFGPTEFKTLLVLYGVLMALLMRFAGPATARTVALAFLLVLLALGVVQLIVNLVRAVRQVNGQGPPPDVSEWTTTRA